MGTESSLIPLTPRVDEPLQEPVSSSATTQLKLLIMATTDDALETYNHLPVHIDPSTKAVSVNSSDKAVQDAVALVNDLHTQFKSLETANNIPPPPVPVNPKRTAQINKLRESAGQSAKKGNNAEAVRLLTFALDMASARPDWEPVGLKREELAICYLARAAANAELRE